jgi:4-diphosphocytidyl-2-C-methyl-D-erythritol kinase
VLVVTYSAGYQHDVVRRPAPTQPSTVERVVADLGRPSVLVDGFVAGTWQIRRAGGSATLLVEPFEPLAPHAFVIVPQPYPLSTAEVYREADRLRLPRDRDELQARYERLVRALLPGARLDRELLVNDLEPAALSLRPEIADAVEAVRTASAEHAFVCGSGPTVAGVFWGEDGEARADAAAAELRGRFAGAVAASPVDADFGMPRFP